MNELHSMMMIMSPALNGLQKDQEWDENSQMVSMNVGKTNINRNRHDNHGISAKEVAKDDDPVKTSDHKSTINSMINPGEHTLKTDTFDPRHFKSGYYQICFDGSKRKIIIPSNNGLNKKDTVYNGINDPHIQVMSMNEENKTSFIKQTASKPKMKSRSSSGSPSKIPLKSTTSKCTSSASDARKPKVKTNSSKPDLLFRNKSVDESDICRVNRKKTVVKSNSVCSVKSSRGSRIPLPKTNPSLDHWKNRDSIVKAKGSDNPNPLLRRYLSQPNSNPTPIPALQHESKNKLCRSYGGITSLSTRSVGVGFKVFKPKTEQLKVNNTGEVDDISKTRISQSKILKERRILSKTSLESSINTSLSSVDIPSAEELERRLSDEAKVSEKLKELNALFTLEQGAASKIVPSNEQRGSSTKNKRTHPRRTKGCRRKSKEGHETSWVHLSGISDFSDLKIREMMLKNQKGYDSSSESTSSDDNVKNDQNSKLYHKNLHALHRIRRQRKRASDKDLVISYIPRSRASIVNRQEFYYRFGEEEKEAMASFKFLEDMSTSTSSSGSDTSLASKSYDVKKLLVDSYLKSNLKSISSQESLNDCELVVSDVDHISLSDSLCEIYDVSDDMAEMSTNMQSIYL